MEQRRFGRVQVFRIIVGADDAATEGDGASSPVTDGKHQAVAETIVMLAIVFLHQHAGLG